MGKALNPDFAACEVFESLFSNTRQNTVFLMNSNGIVKEINTAFTDFFGYSGEDIIGKHFSILFTEEGQLKALPQKELQEVLSSASVTTIITSLIKTKPLHGYPVNLF